MSRYNIGAVVFLIAIFWATAGHALIVSMDQFTITQGATTIVNDPFDGASPPPSGPNGATTYIVSGSFPAGSESGGLLQMNSANGVFTANAIETPRRTLVVENSNLLNNSGVLVDTGLFNLTIPTGPLFSAYGIRFSDQFPNASPPHPGQLVQLFVEFNPTTQQADIAYILQDFVNNTITQLDSRVPLSSAIPSGGADQIFFTLSEATAGGAFCASYEFYKGGSDTGSGGTFANCLALPGFSAGTEQIRGQFFVAQGVPEPGSWLLMGVGLVALVVTAQRREVF